MRDSLFRAAFRAAAPAGLRSRLSILIFHRVLPAPDLLRPGEPCASEFEAKMRLVRSWFNVLPLTDAVRHLKSGTLPERPLCVTFDDGYADNDRIARPILEQLAVPATFFIATAFLDGGRMFNDTIIEAVRAFPGDEMDGEEVGLGRLSMKTVSDRRAAIAALLMRTKYLQPVERLEAASKIAARVGRALPGDLMMASRDVPRLARGLFSVGAHTAGHPILAEIGADDAHREISASRQVLEALTQSPVSLFAYPNGRPRVDYDKRHPALVKELGFAAAVSTAWGVATGDSDVMQLPRFTPWDRTPLRYGIRLVRNMRNVDVEVA